MTPARGAAADDYDALADLFLGPTEAEDRPRRRHPLDDDAPAPLKVPTGERTGVEALPGLRPGFDADAAGDDDHGVPPREDDPPLIDPASPELEPAGRIELVVPAHLPVMASAWVHQYARATAVRTGGCVGLMRFRGATVSVEAVGFADELSALGPAPSAAAAARSASPVCRAWMVQAPEGARPCAGVSCVTILTGADDAAVVGCYRKLKELFPSGAAAATRARVVIVGASPDRSAAAMRKISRAACEFLGRTVEFGEPLPRVGSGPGDPSLVLRPLHAGPAEGDLEDFLAVIARAAASAGEPPRRQPNAAPPAAPTRVSRAPVVVEPLEPPASKPPAAMPQGSGPGPVAPLAEASPMPSTRLVTLVPGLSPLPFPCPVALGVELAFDAEGRLHVLAGADLASAPGPAAEAVEALLAACAWATLNAGLLRSASPSIRRLDESTPPSMHLVTGEPVKARRLLDAPLRVHVVVTARGPGHVAKALN
jgi:hypothetical protein